MTEIRHQDNAPENGRFVLLVDGEEVGEMTYTYAGSEKAVFDHTYVQPAHRGGNRAMMLFEAAMEWVRKKGIAIYPLCPYVDKVLTVRKAEYGDVPRAEFRFDELTGELLPCDFGPGEDK